MYMCMYACAQVIVYVLYAYKQSRILYYEKMFYCDGYFFF